MGIVDTNIVTVSGQNQVATLRLRSGQIGEDQIRVSSTSGITRDASVGATYRVPLLLLGFAIAGSLIGALIGWLIRGGVGRSLVGGFLWGLVTAALYAIGVNLVPSLPTGLVGHGAIFGVSAVAAAGGYVLNSVVDVG